MDVFEVDVPKPRTRTSEHVGRVSFDLGTLDVGGMGVGLGLSLYGKQLVWFFNAVLDGKWEGSLFNEDISKNRLSSKSSGQISPIELFAFKQTILEELFEELKAEDSAMRMHSKCKPFIPAMRVSAQRCHRKISQLWKHPLPC